MKLMITCKRPTIGQNLTISTLLYDKKQIKGVSGPCKHYCHRKYIKYIIPCAFACTLKLIA